MLNFEKREFLKQIPFKRSLAVVAAGAALAGCGDNKAGDPKGLPEGAEYQGAQEIDAGSNQPQPLFGPMNDTQEVRIWRISGRDFKTFPCPEGQEFSYHADIDGSSYVNGSDITEFVEVWCRWD